MCTNVTDDIEDGAVCAAHAPGLEYRINIIESYKIASIPAPTVDGVIASDITLVALASWKKQDTDALSGSLESKPKTGAGNFENTVAVAMNGYKDKRRKLFNDAHKNGVKYCVLATDKNGNTFFLKDVTLEATFNTQKASDASPASYAINFKNIGEMPMRYTGAIL